MKSHTTGRLLMLHDATDADENGTYRGETWAESSDGQNGHIKWHSDGMIIFIDAIETDGRTPLLGARLLKMLWDVEGLPLDPGLMNEAGKRLWRLFRARYSYD